MTQKENLIRSESFLHLNLIGSDVLGIKKVESNFTATSISSVFHIAALQYCTDLSILKAGGKPGRQTHTAGAGWTSWVGTTTENATMHFTVFGANSTVSALP